MAVPLVSEGWTVSDQESNPVGRPLAFKTVQELQDAVDLYFETDAFMVVGYNATGLEIKQFAPTMSGLALSLGVDRKTITNYANKDEFFPTIKKARAKVEVALEQGLYGKNVTGLIFNLKNNFGWADKQEDSAPPTSIKIEIVNPHADD